MKLHLGFLIKLTIGCALALAMPGSALAAPTPANVVVKTAPSAESGQATFTITCGDLDNPVPMAPRIPNTGQINYATSNGTATKGDDYAEKTGSVACTALTPSHDVTVDIVGDALDEPSETFNFTITAAADSFSGGAVSKSVSATIPDDDVPKATFENYLLQVLENAGSATLTVQLDQPSWQAVTVPYSTLNASALAGSDYTATSGTLTIPANTSKATFTVPIIDDSDDEKAEAFFVTLGNGPTGVVYDETKRQGTVTIFDNDEPALPVFSLAKNERVTEGDSGTVNLIFTVNLSFAYFQRTQVAWKTANWTATLADYEGSQGIVVFEPGETSKTFSVNVKGDTRKETTEMFAVIIEKPTFGTIGQANALGIIDDDDQESGGGGEPAAGPKVGIGKPTRERRRLSTFLSCPRSATACNGRLTATARNGALRVGRKRFELTSGGKTDLTFKMTKKAFRKLKKRSLRVKFTVVAKDAAGNVGTSTRKFRIRRIRPS